MTERVPVAFRTYKDLVDLFPDATIDVVARTPEGEVAAVAVRRGARREVFALAGFQGYREAWASGMGLAGTPEGCEIDHVYPENSALGDSKKGFQAQLTEWRKAHAKWEKGGRIGPPPLRPQPLNYQWIRLEAVHKDVNGQVGRMLESRTSRLRLRTNPAGVRYAGPFERMKLDAIHTTHLDDVRVPVWKQGRLALVAITEYKKMPSTRLRVAFVAAKKAVPKALAVVGPAGLGLAIMDFLATPVYAQTENLLAQREYGKARRLWMKKVATELDGERDLQVQDFQEALASEAGVLQVRVREDFPAVMRAYYELMEADARAEAAAIDQLDEPDDVAPVVVPDRIAFADLAEGTPVMLSVANLDMDVLIGAEARLAARAWAGTHGSWVPLTDAPLTLHHGDGRAGAARTDAFGNAVLVMHAPGEVGEYVLVAAVGDRATNQASLRTYGYEVAVVDLTSPEERPARADGSDAVVVTLQLVRREAHGRRPAHAPGDVPQLMLVESVDSGDTISLGFGAGGAHGPAGAAFRVAPGADGRATVSMVSRRAARRTVEVHGSGGRLAALHPTAGPLGSFQVRFEETMPGLMLEWDDAAAGNGDRLAIRMASGSTDPRELRIRAVTRRTGTPVPVEGVRIRLDVEPKEGVQVNRADAETGTDGLARALDGKLPALYGPGTGKTVVKVSANGSATVLTAEVEADNDLPAADVELELTPALAIVDLREAKRARIAGRCLTAGQAARLPERYRLVVEAPAGGDIDGEPRYTARPPHWGLGDDQSRYMDLQTDSGGAFEFSVGATSPKTQVVVVRVWDTLRSEYVRALEGEVRFVEAPDQAGEVVARGPFTTVHERVGKPATAGTGLSSAGLSRGKGRLYVLMVDGNGDPMVTMRSVFTPGTDHQVAYSFGSPMDLDPGEYEVVTGTVEPERHRVRVRSGAVTTLRVSGFARLCFDPRDGLREPASPLILVRKSGQTRDLTYSFGGPLDLRPGTYDLIMGYTPEVRHEGLVLRANRETTVRASGYGRLEFFPTDGLGQPCSPLMRVRRAGKSEEVTYSFGGPVDVPPGAYDVEVGFTPPLVLRVEVKASVAAPVRAGGYGRIQFEMAGPGRMVTVRDAASDREVTYSFGREVDVPPGRYTLVAGSGDGEFKAAATVVAGRAVMVQIPKDG